MVEVKNSFFLDHKDMLRCSSVNIDEWHLMSRCFMLHKQFPFLKNYSTHVLIKVLVWQSEAKKLFSTHSYSFLFLTGCQYLLEFSVNGLVLIINCHMSGLPLLSAISGLRSILYFHLKDCAHPGLKPIIPAYWWNKAAIADTWLHSTAIFTQSLVSAVLKSQLN